MTQLVVPPVPADLRTPVPGPSLEAETAGDIAAIIVNLEASRVEANGKITATDCILRDAEAEAGMDVKTCAPPT